MPPAAVTRAALTVERAVTEAFAQATALFQRNVPTVPDFPIKGILFKDIAPFLAQPGAITLSTTVMAKWVDHLGIDKILAVDARGFVLGAALADRLGAGFVMVRKPGKLPGRVHSFDYTCEYRSGELEITHGIVKPGDKCLVLDDLLATGGTARATADFAASLGADIVGFSFMTEIEVLGGRKLLADRPVYALFKC
jgi:adenine phosphoribosyltransferase